MKTINEVVAPQGSTIHKLESYLYGLGADDILFVPQRDYGKLNMAIHTHFRTRTFQRKQHVWHPTKGQCVAVRAIREPVYHG